MKNLLIALLLLITFNTFAQTHQIDSLKRILRTEIADTTRVKALISLSYLTMFSNPDTSLVITQQALTLARQQGSVKYVADLLNQMGFIFWITGNYPKSLEYHFQALKKSESIHRQISIIASLISIGNVYVEMSELNMAISYYRKAKALAESIGNTAYSINLSLNLGNAYEELNKLDSARIYTNQGYELAIRFNNQEMICTALNNLGNIHSKMQQGEIAMGFYRQSLPLAYELKDFDCVSETTLGMAGLFKRYGQRDSTLHYARLSLDAATKSGFTKHILKASTFLSGYYKGLNQIDSAYYYQGITIAAKDSLFSQEKVKEVQNLSFMEKIRQQEIEEARRVAAEERKTNIQLLGIATFISFFFGLLFVIRKRHVNPKVIRFLGLVGLLLLFEFISLFLHPYIAKWMHHIPVLMLLILVGIASILVPLHHALEGLVREKLAKKTMKIPSEALPDPSASFK